MTPTTYLNHLRDSKILLAVLTTGVVGMASLLIYIVATKPAPIEQGMAGQQASTRQMLITSVPENTEITLSKPCADGKLKVKTPYVCKTADASVKVVAPQNHSSADYTFKAWEGCQAEKADALSCTLSTDLTKSTQLKAVYEKKPRVVIVQTAPPAVPANPCDSSELNGGGFICTLNLSKYKDRQTLILEYHLGASAYRSITYISVYCTKQPQNETCPGLEHYPNSLQTSIPIGQFDKEGNSLVVYSERKLTSLDCDYDYDPVTNYTMPDCPKKEFNFKSVEGTSVNASTYKITFHYSQN